MEKQSRYRLVCHATEEILYEGWFTSLKCCVEAAVARHVSLDGVDLTGANLSEGVFDHADMCGADLAYACLALSSLMNGGYDGRKLCRN